MKKILPFVLLVLVVLYFTNPTIEEFQSDIQQQLMEEMSEDADSNEGWQQMLSRPISWLVKESTEHSNYFFFSVFTVGEGDNEQFKYLGIFDQFVSIKKSDSLSINIDTNQEEKK